jgi:hypothetical protein
MEDLALAGIKAELRADGLPTHGGAAELAARLAEYGDGWTEPAVKVEIKMEVEVEEARWTPAAAAEPDTRPAVAAAGLPAAEAADSPAAEASRRANVRSTSDATAAAAAAAAAAPASRPGHPTDSSVRRRPWRSGGAAPFTLSSFVLSSDAYAAWVEW